MNVPVSEQELGGAVEIVARPNRSADPATLIAVFAVLSVTVLLVSLISYMQGNVLAPLFALLDVLLVGVSLALVWRRGADHDRIRLAADEVAIVLGRPGARFTRPAGCGSGASATRSAAATACTWVRTAVAPRWVAS